MRSMNGIRKSADASSPTGRSRPEAGSNAVSSPARTVSRFRVTRIYRRNIGGSKVCVRRRTPVETRDNGSRQNTETIPSWNGMTRDPVGPLHEGRADGMPASPADVASSQSTSCSSSYGSCSRASYSPHPAPTERRGWAWPGHGKVKGVAHSSRTGSATPFGMEGRESAAGNLIGR